MASFKEVSLDIKKSLKELGDSDALLRNLGATLHTLTLDRIFTEGKKSDGGGIGTYKASTIKSKKKKNRFTSNKINLRNTEDLAGDYIFTVDIGVLELGFAGTNRKDGGDNSEIREWLEKKFGDIFAMTSQEEEDVDNIINDFVEKNI